jgi:hypothetical protein
MKTTLLVFIMFFVTNMIFTLNDNKVNNEIIIDSQISFEDAIKNTPAPKNIINQLVLIDVEYYSFDNRLHIGQLLVNISVKDDIIAIFELIKKEKFPIEKCIPIVAYNWDDDLSINANNSSAFCYRKIAGTNRLSYHSFGKAIDINPMQNPYISSKGVSKRGNKYNPQISGTLTINSPITRKFIELGWEWGGNYKKIKDWHHFSKK